MAPQSPESVATLWFHSLDRGDFATAMGCLAEDIEWVNIAPVDGVSALIPWIGTALGIAEVVKAFQLRDAHIDLKSFKPRRLIVHGNDACGTIDEVSVVKETGLEFSITFATWLRIEDGKIVRWQSYCDPSPIVAAFRPALARRLVAAAKARDVEAARGLLRGGASPDARDGDGLTALMVAACRADPAMVRLLLEAGADVHTTDPRTGATALHKACQGGSVEVVRRLLDAGAFVDAVAPTTGHTAIMDALWYKWIDVVALLAERGANLELRTHYGFTLDQHLEFELRVNQGAERQKFVAIQEIVAAARARARRAIEEQTVMAAAAAGDPAAVRRQLAAGAVVDSVYPRVCSFLDGHTPLHVAARDGHVEIVRDLLAARAPLRVEDWVFKGSPIHKASYNGNPEILRMIATQPGVDLDVQGPINGYTPLHDALWHGFAKCARILIELGARLDLAGHDGKTPLDLSREVLGGAHEVTRLLEQRLAAGRSS